MDLRKGKRFAYYNINEVESFLCHNTEERFFKQINELLVGCVLARCREEIHGELPKIGYMVKGVYSLAEKVERPELEELINSNNIEDRDVDIWLRLEVDDIKIQISRLESHGAKNNALDGLKRILRKKSLVATDKKLQLVVLIDYTFDVNLKKLKEYISTLNNPYGRIYLVGQIGMNIKLGNFRCMEIFPETRSTDVKINPG